MLGHRVPDPRAVNGWLAGQSFGAGVMRSKPVRHTSDTGIQYRPAGAAPAGRTGPAGAAHPRYLSGTCLEDDVERGLGGAAEPGEPGRADDVRDPRLTGLCPEGEPDLLRQ